MFAVTRLRVPAADVAGITEAATALIAALRACPGFRDGELGRAADDPDCSRCSPPGTAWAPTAGRCPRRR